MKISLFFAITLVQASLMACDNTLSSSELPTQKSDTGAFFYVCTLCHPQDIYSKNRGNIGITETDDGFIMHINKIHPEIRQKVNDENPKGNCNRKNAKLGYSSYKRLTGIEKRRTHHQKTTAISPLATPVGSPDTSTADASERPHIKRIKTNNIPSILNTIQEPSTKDFPGNYGMLTAQQIKEARENNPTIALATLAISQLSTPSEQPRISKGAQTNKKQTAEFYFICKVCKKDGKTPAREGDGEFSTSESLLRHVRKNNHAKMTIQDWETRKSEFEEIVKL